MALAPDKYTQLTIRGKDETKPNMIKNLNNKQKGLSVIVSGILNWSSHIENRLINANKWLCGLRRNVAKEVKSFAKLGLYKLLTIRVLNYGLNCSMIRRTDMLKLEKFHKKAATWTFGSRNE